MRRVGWLAGVLVALAACDRGPVRLDASKEVLVTLPPTYRRGSVVVAKDGRSWAYLDARPDGVRVVTGGVAGPPWADAVKPTLAPRGGHVGYWATDDKTVEPPPVSLVVDGVARRTDLARPGTLVFAPDGSRWAAAGGLPERTDPPGRGATVVWVDGAEAGRWPDTTAPAFSQDGKHVGWLAEDDDRRISVTVDGQVRRRFEKPGPDTSPPTKLQNFGPTLGPQMVLEWMPGGDLLVLVPTAEGWVLERGERRLGTWPTARLERSGGVLLNFGDRFAQLPAIASGSVSIAESAPVVAWWERLAGEAERWRVVRDGTPVDDVLCHAYLETQPPPTLSADGRHVAYGCRLAAAEGTPQIAVVADGRRFGPYFAAYGVAIAAGGTCAYAATEDSPQTFPQRWRYYVDGRPLGQPIDEAWRPRLDASGEHLAWEATPHKQAFLGFDAITVARFDDVFWGPEFASDRTVSWVIRRGRRLARVNLAF